MAFVRENPGPSLGQRINEGIEGAIGAIGKGIDWLQQKQLNEAKLSEIKQHQAAIDQEMKAKQAEGERVATNQWGEALIDAAMSEKPKDYISMNAPRFNQLRLHVPGASSMTQEDLESLVIGLKSNLTKPLTILKQSQSALLNPSTSDKVADQAYQSAKEALGQIKGASPYSTQDVWSLKMGALEQMAEKRFSARMAEKMATAKAQDPKELDKEARKELTNSENVITGVATRGTASMFGQSAKRAFGGRLLDNMLDKVDNPSTPEADKLVATKQVAMTFARNFDATISQGGSSAEFAQHMVPPSFEGDAKGFWQKVSSDPKTYLTPAFLKNFANEIKVERDTVSGDMGQMISAKYDALGRNYGQQYADSFLKTAQERFKNDKFVSGAITKAFESKNGSGPKLGADEEIVNGYVVNHKTKQVLRKAE